MYNYKLKQPQEPSHKFPARPVTIVVILILLITGFFLGKFYLENKKNENLRTKIEAENRVAENIQVDSLTAEQVNSLIRKSDVQLVDIRELSEFELKHIESSINIPLSRIEEKIDLLEQDKQIVIIDREESVPGKILTDHLKSEGLDIKYLSDGIMGYSQEGYSLINIGDPTSSEDLLKVTSITAEELKKKMLENGEIFTFVDVRSALKYNQDHIDGSINIPLENIEKKRSSLTLGRIVVYDDEQIRSFRAASRLYDMNVIGVYNLIDNHQTLKQVLFEKEKETSEKESIDSATPPAE